MENQRLFLFVALGILAILLWNAWQQDYGQHQAPPAAVTSKTQSKPQPASEATPKTQASAPATQAPAQATKSAPTGVSTQGSTAAEALPPRGKTIRVTTDLLDIAISTRGGSIRSARLRAYPLSTKDRKPFTLLSDRQQPIFVAQAGLKAAHGSSPDSKAIFTSPKAEYTLPPGQDELKVPFTWTGPNGVTVTKTYTFHRNKYLVGLSQEISNSGTQPWSAFQYLRLRREKEKKSKNPFFIHTYTGGVIHSAQKKYEKISFDDMGKSPLNRDIKDGWGAIIQHYFLAAWIPPRAAEDHYYTRALPRDEYLLGLNSALHTVKPGGKYTFSSDLYVGPKENQRLTALSKSMAPGIDLTVDYGYLTFIARPLFVALRWIESVVGNWGWAIIILTILIKLVFYKLSEMSYRSMAKMRRLQPRMAHLKERFGDDKQRLNEAMMKLYKEEKVNPLGGCLPMFIQIPVFISLYWMLLESVELRQAPFILWIHDLSAPDPYFVLPILMGITMLIQQRLNPSPVDPIQQKVMMFLPIVFTAFFLFFPSGLVLYYVFNNALSIAQQYLITRRLDKQYGKQ